MDENFELLTQGSVWTKNAGAKAGKQSKVLWLTNQTLSDKAKVKHPMQVVYVDEEGAVYNRTPEEFFEQYSFYNIDPDLETRLESLLPFNEDDYEDEEGDEEVSLDDSDDAGDEPEQTAEEVMASTLSTARKSLPPNQTLADYLISEDEGSDNPHIGSSFEEALQEMGDEGVNDTEIVFILSQGTEAEVTPASLSNNLIAYAQEPNSDMSMIRHRLLFRLSSELTIQTLQQSFYPDDEQKSAVDAFTINGPFYNEVIAWTDYLGVFPEFAHGAAYASVLLGVDLNVVNARVDTPEDTAEGDPVTMEDPNLPSDVEFKDIELAPVAHSAEEISVENSVSFIVPPQIVIPEVLNQVEHHPVHTHVGNEPAAPLQ